MRIQKWHNWAIFTALAGLILGPLLAPGYILTLDLSWGRHLGAVSFGSNGWALHQVLAALMAILPSWVVEKLLLMLIFVLAGVGLARLAARRAPGWPAIVGGVLYVVNPFTYERLMAGQWLVLAGYALLPWVTDALVGLLDRPGWRRALALAAWAAALGVVSLHLSGMALAVGLAITATHLWGRWRGAGRSARWVAVAGGAAIVVSAGWLVLGHAGLSREIAGFEDTQFTAFRTAGAGVGAPLNVLALQGFWGESHDIVTPPSSIGAWFWLAWGLVALVIGAGLAVGVRQRDRLALALAATAVVAWVLALGVAWGPAAAITHWLVARVPLYRGYREPEKWVAVLALGYSYFFATGVRALAARFHGFWHGAAVAVAGLLPLLLVPMMLWGAAGQLVSTDYPPSWYTLNDRLNHLQASPAGQPDTLVLPWHQYLYLNFARRTVANPAPGFFDRPVIVSNDPELLGVTPSFGPGLVSQIQENVINRRFFETNVGTRLHPLGVRYVVLMKVSDWTEYTWLRNQSDLTLVADDPQWQLYETMATP